MAVCQFAFVIERNKAFGSGVSWVRGWCLGQGQAQGRQLVLQRHTFVCPFVSTAVAVVSGAGARAPLYFEYTSREGSSVELAVSEYKSFELLRRARDVRRVPPPARGENPLKSFFGCRSVL